ncbi:hypothetical protein KKC94_04225 [Patescibacteria group bacterium]|nr:hypothetical protein [Patescibacteria group bacterium]
MDRVRNTTDRQEFSVRLSKQRLMDILKARFNSNGVLEMLSGEDRVKLALSLNSLMGRVDEEIRRDDLTPKFCPFGEEIDPEAITLPEITQSRCIFLINKILDDFLFNFVEEPDLGDDLRSVRAFLVKISFELSDIISAASETPDFSPVTGQAREQIKNAVPTLKRRGPRLGMGRKWRQD